MSMAGVFPQRYLLDPKGLWNFLDASAFAQDGIRLLRSQSGSQLALLRGLLHFTLWLLQCNF